MTTQKTLICASVLLGMSLSAQAETLTIAIDRSGSNPLLSHQNFANAAAEHARQAVQQLTFGDTIQILSFGAMDDPDNLIVPRIRLDRRNRPASVAGGVAGYIQSIPKQTGIGQSSTNIVGFLEEGGFDCASGSTILLITDGWETGALEHQRLPDPAIDLTGCTLVFYKLDAGGNRESARTLRAQWSQWAEASGAGFTALAR